MRRRHQKQYHSCFKSRTQSDNIMFLCIGCLLWAWRSGGFCLLWTWRWVGFCLLWAWRWVGFPKSCPHVVVIVPRMVTLCQFWGHRVWVKTFSNSFLRQFCFKLQFGSVFANLQFSLRPWLSIVNLHYGFLHRMRKISNMTSNFD